MSWRVCRIAFADGSVLYSNFSTVTGSTSGRLFAASETEVENAENADSNDQLEALALRDEWPPAVQPSGSEVVVVEAPSYGTWWGVADRAAKTLFCGFNADDLFGGTGLEREVDDLFKAICPGDWTALAPMTVSEAFAWAGGDVLKAATALQATWTLDPTWELAAKQPLYELPYVARMRAAIAQNAPSPLAQRSLLGRLRSWAAQLTH